MTPSKTFGLTLVALLLTTGCDEHFDTGPMRTEQREVGSFDCIDVDGDVEMQVTVGSPASLAIKGRDSAIRRISTEVRDKTLYVEIKRKDWMMGGPNRVEMRISVPQLKSLKLDGGNEVRLAGFTGGESDITMKGAGHVEAAGSLDELTLSLAGAGHADFSKLVAHDAKVTVDGVGSVLVNSQDSLDATMNGVGAILYSGNPHKVNTSVNGLGSISQMNSRHAKRHKWNRHRRVDPDSLQPEYDDKAREEAADRTEVTVTT